MVSSPRSTCGSNTPFPSAFIFAIEDLTGQHSRKHSVQAFIVFLCSSSIREEVMGFPSFSLACSVCLVLSQAAKTASGLAAPGAGELAPLTQFRSQHRSTCLASDSWLHAFTICASGEGGPWMEDCVLPLLCKVARHIRVAQTHRIQMAPLGSHGATWSRRIDMVVLAIRMHP